MVCAMEVLTIHEEIVKYSKKRFIILNMLNLVNEYNRPPERGCVEE